MHCFLINFPVLWEHLFGPLADEEWVKHRKKVIWVMLVALWHSPDLCLQHMLQPVTKRRSKTGGHVYQTLSTSTSLSLSSDKVQERWWQILFFFFCAVALANSSWRRLYGSLLSCRSSNTPRWLESPTGYSHRLHPQQDTGCLAMSLDVLHE